METGASGFVGRYKRDYYGGALMMLIGLGAVVQGSRYRIGSLTHMGSGFFPVAIGVMLVIVGALIAATARRPARSIAPAAMEQTIRPAPEWRGWSCILLSIVAFVVLGKYAGLVPAAFAITFISALGDRDNSWKSALVLALGIVVVAVVVFWWGLQLDLPLFGTD